MVALLNTADHYIFILSFALLLSFFPRLISAVADLMSNLHTWCGLSANLRCRSETCCMRLTENTERKKLPKIPIWPPSHNCVGIYLRNEGAYRQSEKNLFSSNISSNISARRSTGYLDSQTIYQMDSNVKETDGLSALNVVYVREGSNVIVCKIT